MTAESTLGDESNKQQKSILMSAAYKAARQDLVDMAKEGMADWYLEKSKFSNYRWQSWSRRPGNDDSIFDLMPKSMTHADYSVRSSGLFKGLEFSQIVGICFEDDAFKFILRHAYNNYLFWFLVYQVLIVRENEPQVPYKLEYVKRRLSSCRSTSYGSGVQLSDAIVAKLKATQASMHGMIDGSQIEVDKLPVGLASYLKDLGLVLELESKDAYGVPNLLMNPMLTEMLQELNAQGNQLPATDNK